MRVGFSACKCRIPFDIACVRPYGSCSQTTNVDHFIFVSLWDVCRTEDSTGPTTCEITIFDPEPNIELPFDTESTQTFYPLR